MIFPRGPYSLVAGASCLALRLSQCLVPVLPGLTSRMVLVGPYSLVAGASCLALLLSRCLVPVLPSLTSRMVLVIFPRGLSVLVPVISCLALRVLGPSVPV